MIALFSFACALTVLAYASYCDLKTRTVSDAVWLIGVPAGLASSIARILLGQLQLFQLLASVAVSAFLGFMLFRFGLVGGADALAFIFLGLTVPAYPQGFPVYGDPLGLPALSTFCNAVLLSMACPLAVFALNVADVVRGRNPFRGVEVNGVGEILVMLFTARRVSLEKLGLHYFPAERVEFEGGKAVRRPAFFLRAEADVEEIAAKMALNRELYADGVLASPTIPMITFLTLGLLLSLLGNFVLLAAMRLLGLPTAPKW